jgi:hypothetical protein
MFHGRFGEVQKPFLLGAIDDAFLFVYGVLIKVLGLKISTLLIDS